VAIRHFPCGDDEKMRAGACFYFVLAGWMPCIKKLPSGPFDKPLQFVARRLNRTASQTVIMSDNLPVHAPSPEHARCI
jgi:hypothetical protein